MNLQEAALGDATHPVGYRATSTGYATGFALSLLLTAIPFWLVMNDVLPRAAAAAIILCFAAVQMVVHMICFLHIDRDAEGGWSLTALIFTAVLVAVLLGGSTWVMYHMNANMPRCGASGRATYSGTCSRRCFSAA